MLTNRRELMFGAVASLAATASLRTRAQTNDRLAVLATFSILGDFVRNVGGDRIALAVLVGPNGDAHVYEPAPADARKVADARLVFVNGLGFEGWMDRLVQASGTKAPLVIATKGIAPLKTVEHGRSTLDPHAWQSVENAKVYVANVRDALLTADPVGGHAARAAAYLERLDGLDREVRAALAAVPADRRKVISTHDAFGYFAQAYGITFIAPEGVSTDAEPSARDIARIVDQIKQQKIPAVFLENISDPRLIRQIAAESGARIGGTLYSDALTGPDGEAPTYIDLMRHNVREIAMALAG